MVIPLTDTSLYTEERNNKMSNNTKLDRMKLVACLEYIARHVNDEELFYNIWATYGVADGDIPYGHIPLTTYKEENLENYIEDDNIIYLIEKFLYMMHRVYLDDSGLQIE